MACTPPFSKWFNEPKTVSTGDLLGDHIAFLVPGNQRPTKGIGTAVGCGPPIHGEPRGWDSPTQCGILPTKQMATPSKIGAVIRVSVGNFLEMYDFMVFGYYAAAIGRAFFPNGNPFASLMLSLMTFGAGFLMRPVGALVLGAYTDKHGRRAGLLLTLSLMSVGIFTIACTPGYATIGLLAPLLVVVGRLLQGFSAGMELGGVSVYLSEIATPGHKGFYVSWQSG